MFAIIETGGKQYKVSEGDRIRIELLGIGDGEEVDFEKVLLVSDGEKTQEGRPYLEKTVVKGKVLGEDREKKIIVFKFKRRKKFRNKTGHRQNVSVVEILSIGSGGKKTSVKKQKEQKPVEETAAVESE